MDKSIIKLRPLLIVLALLMLMSCLSFSSYAKSTDFCYEEIDGQICLTGFAGKVTETIEFPSKIKGKKVVSIGDHIFDGYWNSDYEKIKKIVMPDTITSIGECAFRGCKGLKSVVLSENLTEIKSGAFCDCDSLERISIPDGVKEIADNLFAGSEKLKEVNFSKDVKRIGYNSFSGCKSLERFNYPEGVKEVEWSTFSFCDKLKFVYLPKSITIIADEAFAGCSSLADISIPAKVKEIGGSAFWGCSNLKKIDLPKKLERIESYTFAFSGLKKIELPETVSYIGDEAFYQCKFKTVKFPKILSYIGRNAFYCCQSIEEIVIPGSVETISYSAFGMCSALKTVVIENGVKYINEEAFCCSGIETLVLPDSLIMIENDICLDTYNLKTILYTGSKDEWKKIYIFNRNAEFNNAEIIYNYISSEHTKLKKQKATIGTCNKPGYTEGVYCKHCNKWIKGHQKIEVLHSDINVDRICDECGQSTIIESGKCGDDISWVLYDDGELYINGSGKIFDFDLYSKSKVRKLIYGNGIESTGCFYSYKNLESISFPDTLKTISFNAFRSCSSLKEVVIPKNVTNIDQRAFANCISLKSVVLPPNLDYIDFGAFTGCESLKKVDLPDKIKYIDTHAFSNCIKLENIDIPDKVKFVEESAFDGCSNLKTVSVGKNTNSIDSLSFDNCPNLEKFIVHKDNKYFSTDKNGVLYNKKKTKLLEVPENLKLNVFVIPNSVTYIGNSSLSHLNNVDVIVIPTSVKKIDNSEFCLNDNVVVCYEGSKTQYKKIKIREFEESNYDENSIVFNFGEKFLPSKADIKKITSGNKKLSLTWKAVSKADGYVVEYSTSKDFSSKTKKVNLKKSAKKATIKKLKSGKKYYVRVKAYKTVNGKKVYGAYSSVKSVKVK